MGSLPPQQERAEALSVESKTVFDALRLGQIFAVADKKPQNLPPCHIGQYP